MTDQTLSWVLLGLVLKTSRRISPVSKAVDLIHAFITKMDSFDSDKDLFWLKRFIFFFMYIRYM